MAKRSAAVAKRPDDEMWIEWVPLQELITWPGNPKKHDPKTLGESFERHGYIDPIVIDEGSGKIVAGHGRREKLLDLWNAGGAPPKRVKVRADGEWLIPVLRGISWANEHEAEAYLLTSNQSVMAPGYDEDALAVMLERHTVDTKGLGWTDEEIADIRSRAQALETTPEVPEPEPPGSIPPPELEEDISPDRVKNPVTKPGQIWLLGTHRLICGDSRDPDVVRRVMTNLKPFIMVTDPPYGVEYDPECRAHLDGGAGVKVGKFEDKKVSWRKAFAQFTGDVAYVWCADLCLAEVQSDLDALNFIRRLLIIWAKPGLVLGRGHYHHQHEPCWYAVRKGATAKWAGDKKQSTLWNLARANKDNTGDTTHGAQKPVGCMGRPIRNHGKVGDIVYDPFVGSGTTIVAAEQLERRCVAIEKDPGWCDAAIDRWQHLTGEKARKAK